MFQVNFQANGKAGTAYVIAGTTAFGEGIWYLYYSYIAAYNGVPGTVGDALLRTWQSWDPSVNQAERQAQTIITQQETTRIIQSTGEYQRRVYEKTNYNWDAYIRGSDPVLGPGRTQRDRRGRADAGPRARRETLQLRRQSVQKTRRVNAKRPRRLAPAVRVAGYVSWR